MPSPDKESILIKLCLNHGKHYIITEDNTLYKVIQNEAKDLSKTNNNWS